MGFQVVIPELGSRDIGRMARGPEHRAALEGLGPQSGIAALSQANQASSSVLSLLR